jgi:hypothetical protein
MTWVEVTASDLGDVRRQIRLAPPTGIDLPQCDRDAKSFEHASLARDNALKVAGGKPSGPGPDTQVAYTLYWTKWGGERTQQLDNGQLRYDPDSLWLNLSSRVRMPRWIAPTNAAPSQREAWDSYSCRLAAHEWLHLENVRWAALDFLEMATKLQASTEAELRDRLDALGRATLAWVNEEDVRLDRTTCHGPELRDP